MSRNIAVIFAGGTGRRLNGDDTPKQFLVMKQKPIIVHTMLHFERHPQVDAIYASCVEGWIDRLVDMVSDHGITKLRRVVPGGPTAQDSIRLALEAVAEEHEEDDFVLIHDAVRPFITAALIDELLDTANEHGNAVACTPANETFLISRDGTTADEFSDRRICYAAQAPQVFRLGEILGTHHAMLDIDASYEGLPDSASLMKRFGHDIRLVTGTYGNLKITYPEDVASFAGLLAAQEAADSTKP